MGPCTRVVSFVVLAAAASASAETVATRWAHGPARDYPEKEAPTTAKPPSGTNVSFRPKGARYGRVDVLGRPLAFAWTDAEAWFDLDGDGALDDEGPLRVPAHGRLVLRIGEVRIGLRREGERILFALLSHREAQIVVAGRLRDFSARDGDADGTYDDFALDGRSLRAGEPFYVGPQAFLLHRPDPMAARIRIAPAENAPPPPPPVWPKAKTPPAGVRNPKEGELRARVREYRLLRRKREPREHAIAAIGRAGPAAAAELMRVLRLETGIYEREAALLAFGYREFVDEGGLPLLQAVRDPAPRIAVAAIRALHAMDHPEREAAFARILGVPGALDSSVAQAAAQGLAWLDTDSARKRLAEVAAQHHDSLRRGAAYDALTKHSVRRPVRSAVVAIAKDPVATLRARGIRDAARLGFDEAVELALASAHPDASAVVHEAVIAVLGSSIEPRVVRALLVLAPSTRPATRLKIVSALERLRAPEAVDALLDGLDARSDGVRETTARILGSIATRGHAKALAEALRYESESRVKRALAHALGRLQDPLAIPVLLRTARAAKEDAALAQAAREALAALGVGHDDVRAFFLRGLADKDWKTRIGFADTLAGCGDTAAAGLLAEVLDDERWQVRAAAATGLGRMRTRDAIPPLIERLRREMSSRVKRTIHEALIHTTGLNLPAAHRPWWNWWQREARTFRVPPKPPEPRARSGKTVATFYGVPVLSDRVAFVIDRSGSMGGGAPAIRGGAPDSEYKQAVEEAIGACDRLPENARLAVVLFAEKATTWSRDLFTNSARNRKRLRRFLNARKPNGGTNLWAGLARALHMKEVDTIYLLSDGEPTLGTKNPAFILARLRSANRLRRITIHTIALGLDSDLLRTIANEHGGRYHRR